MRKTPALLLLLVAASLAGCPTSPGSRDSGVTMLVDMGTNHVDTGVPPADTGMPDMDAGAAVDVPIASVVNASAADHPADGTQIHVTGDLVALTQRYVSGPSSSMRCLASIWVGTIAGGDNSSIEVIDSYPVDASGDCFMTAAHNIPSTIHIGDAVTNLVGQFQNYCPSGMACPANTSQELAVTNGSFSAGAHVGTPMATTATIAEVTGMGLTFGTRDMALQNALVRITGTVLVTVPDASTHIMTVAAAGTTTPVMSVRLASYTGVGCQRTELTSMTAGATVGDITGILSYSFNTWQLQPTQPSDLPGVPCMIDAGTGADAGM